MNGFIRPACALLAILTLSLNAAEDPYAAWAAGRPAEALAPLRETARRTGRWDAWFDLGLAAAAAGDRGRAAAWLAAALGAAPERSEPRQALRALGSPLPPTWSERLGPVAWPGTGWPGVVLLAIAGLGLGWAAWAPWGRRTALAAGLIALAAGAPGQVAAWLDGRTRWVAVVRDTQLLDSVGNPAQPVAAGSLGVRDAGEPWAGRIVVRLVDGRRGFLALADTEADPPGGTKP